MFESREPTGRCQNNFGMEYRAVRRPRRRRDSEACKPEQAHWVRGPTPTRGQDRPSGRALFPARRLVDNVPYIRALAGGGADPKLVVPKARAGALLRPRPAFGKVRSLVEVREFTCVDRQGRLAEIVVEEKHTEFKLAEMSRVPYRDDAWILEKLVTVGPVRAAHRACLERKRRSREWVAHGMRSPSPSAAQQDASSGGFRHEKRTRSTSVEQSCSGATRSRHTLPVHTLAP